MTLLSILTTVAILGFPFVPGAIQPRTTIQDQCTAEAKNVWYKSFLSSRTNDQPKAYEDAKKYLACPAGQVTEAEQKVIDYLRKWSKAYEDGLRKNRLTQLLYNDKKYVEAYALGNEILTAEPENLKVLIDLGANGYALASVKNPTLEKQALGYATKALQLLESGKTVDDWSPLPGRDVALAYLNYTIGSLIIEKDPGAALKNLLKAEQFETPLKKSPYLYYYIAGAYETGPYKKQSEDYKTVFGGKDVSDESKLALANIHQVIDRMIDAYARAVALAGTDTQFSAQKPAWKESLTSWYKYRNNGSDTGLDVMIGSVLSKPVPPEPTPLMSLPQPTPTPSPTAIKGR